jgi:hypothetical protein
MENAVVKSEEYVRKQFELASSLRLTLACDVGNQSVSRETVRQKYQELRTILEDIIEAKRVLCGSPHTVSDSLTPDENVWVRVWLAEILADGLGGNFDIFRARELCDGLLKTYGYVLCNSSSTGISLYAHVQELLGKVTPTHVRKSSSCEFSDKC